MRTIRIEHVVQLDATSEVRLSTEAIIADDGDAEQAGADARAAVDAFATGWGTEADS